MDFVDRLLGQRWQGVRPETLFKFSDLDVNVQRYLQRVYATLTVALAVTALGAYLDVAYSIGGLLTYAGAFGCMLGLAWTPSTPQTLNKRYALLAGFAFCQGAGLGRLISMAVALNPAILLTACLGTGAVFASFTLASLLSPRRSFLYLGGYLASAITAFMAMRLAGWLLGSGVRGAAFSLELYGGLLVFAGYVLFDTQLIVEKAALGHTDHVKAALDLLVDVIAIFVRIVIILMKNQAKREEEERKKRAKRQ